MQSDKTQLQLILEKYVADINPMHLVIGTDSEYEDEVELFLERAPNAKDSEELEEIIRQIFREMFNLNTDYAFLPIYRDIAHEYLRLINNVK